MISTEVQRLKWLHNTVVVLSLCICAMEAVRGFAMWAPSPSNSPRRCAAKSCSMPPSHSVLLKTCQESKTSFQRPRTNLNYARTGDANKEKSATVNQFLRITTSKETSPLLFEQERNRLATQLLNACRLVGTQVGMDTTQENRDWLVSLVKAMKEFSDKKPASIPLEGSHDLVYSASKSGFPAGKVGPFVGDVKQIFHNVTVYENVLDVGPFKLSVFASRKIMDDTRIEVSFYTSTFKILGVPILRQPFKAIGVWDNIFVGVVDVDDNDCSDEGGLVRKRRLLLRAMHTPELFILTQDIPEFVDNVSLKP